MAKVLKCTKGGERAYYTDDGGKYIFNDGGRFGPVELFKNEEHAAELLKHHPDDLKEVPIDKWPEHYKSVVHSFEDSRIKEAAEKFPDLVKAKVLGTSAKKAK